MMNKIFNAIFKSNGAINIKDNEANNNNISISAGDNVSIINGKVYINGEEKDNLTAYKGKEIKISLTGNIYGNVEAGNYFTVNGDIDGDVDCGNMCNINSNTIEGDIDTGNMCNIASDTIEGNIDCGNMCVITNNNKN